MAVDTAETNPEVGKSVVAAGLETNYLEQGSGEPVIFIHGSGPGVTGYANWRLTLPDVSKHFRALALDVAGFGYTERKPGVTYNLDFWITHLLGFLDALGIDRAHFVGNSFGGGLTVALAARHPERVGRFVLMGSAGVEFEVTEGLNFAWGYEPSLENMTKLMNYFVYDRSIVTDDLIQSRHEASIRPGYHETYSQMFPSPRQRHVKDLSTPEEQIKAIEQQALIIHGRDDQIVPSTSSLKLHSLIERSDLHMFGQCGHWTQIEKRHQFNRLVTDFLLGN